MSVLGIAGGPHPAHDDPRQFPWIDGYWHDAAAVIVRKGQVVCAYEEERLSRLKHTATFPKLAVRACLDQAGLGLKDLQAVAVYFTESYWETFLTERLLLDPKALLGTAREEIGDRLAEAGGVQLPSERLHFVRHHEAHAVAAWRNSGFEEALVVTLDGAGDTEAGLVAAARNGLLTEMWTVPITHSLGGLYLWVTRFLGYGQFDEYKVAGLAASGNPRSLNDSLRMVRLLPGGRFEVDWQFALRLRAMATPRRRGEPLTAFHADLAAAVQEALEDATLHLLRFMRHSTGLRHLCLAGGVAHNCALTGTIAATELFEGVFVHPASHDAGCALGAALAVEAAGKRYDAPPAAISSVFWGSTVSAGAARDAVRRWDTWIEAYLPDDVTRWAAEQLANGAILGWMRGRAEFGPRALGHRSLICDPRPTANRDRINNLVKQREYFRPLAPVVQAEHAERFFVVPPGVDCSFMSFALRVRPEWQAALGAVTHADGTARVQTVTRTQDSALWDLLDRFMGLTGVPILLNTSLNIAGDPIADAVDDAIDCLLNAPEINALVVEDIVLRRRSSGDPAKLRVVLPSDAKLSQISGHSEGGERRWIVERGGPIRPSAAISSGAADLLQRAPGAAFLADTAAVDNQSQAALVKEMLQLWRDRLIMLRPDGVGA